MMFNKSVNLIKRFDYFLLLLIVFLVVAGFFAVYSAVYDPTNGTVQQHPYKQLTIFAASMILYIGVSFIGYRNIVRLAPILYVLGCISLLLVLFFGNMEMGARRWISIGPFTGQPSEFFKVLWVITIAWVFSDLKDERLGFVKLGVRILWLIPPFLLVYKEPDLGTALTYAAAWGMVTFFLGIKRIIIALVVIGVLVSAPFVWQHLVKPYQKQRVISFFAPDKDPSGMGYQALQSRIAVGSGGISGKGYLKGTQSHLRFMPERHTDFIFSVINEEFGFAGGVSLVLVFMILILRIISISLELKEPQGKVLCIAAASFLLFQFYINTSMTIGMSPIVGVPLPFVSYGGSSLIAYVTMMGLVNSVYICRNDSPIN
ncbi:MAG: rod shape-determining protein RodA [Deferribacteraceae bacterium]|jgi:rod shape determining protein RodA|nr:rod shape-determining protein RodA [Deferribacteraceae bacterium]